MGCCRYIVSDCDSVDVFYKSQQYTKTPEEAAAKAILAGNLISILRSCSIKINDHVKNWYDWNASAIKLLKYFGNLTLIN